MYTGGSLNLYNNDGTSILLNSDTIEMFGNLAYSGGDFFTINANKNGLQLSGLKTPTQPTDAATKEYVDNAIGTALEASY